MPENKYKNGKIYALRSFQTDKIFIGSTCQSLYKRLYDHKHSGWSKQGSANEILQFSDVYIELLENFPCTCKDELDKRTGEIIRENKDKAVNILKNLGKNVIDCPCGEKVLKWTMGLHQDSKTHMTWAFDEKREKKSKSVIVAIQ